MNGLADGFHADVHPPATRRTSHRSVPVLPLVVDHGIGPQLRGFLEFPGVTAGDDGSKTQALADAQGSQGHSPADARDQDPFPWSHPSPGDQHSPGCEVGETKGRGVGRFMVIGDLDEVGDRRQKGFGHGPGSVLSNQLEHLSCGEPSGDIGFDDWNGGVHDDPPSDPSRIDTGSGRVDPTDAVTAGDPRPGSLDAGNALSNPQVEMIEARGFGANSNLPWPGFGIRNVHKLHIRGHGGPTGHDGDCSHAQESRASNDRTCLASPTVWVFPPRSRSHLMTSSPTFSGLRLIAPTLALLVVLCLPGCGDSERSPETTATSTATPAPTPSPDQPVIYPSGSVTIRPGATAVYGEPADVDFGVAKPGSKLQTEIKLVNPTDSAVVIQKAVPTCQCTTVNVDGTTIPARGAVGIPMTLQVPSTTGEITALGMPQVDHKPVRTAAAGARFPPQGLEPFEVRLMA